MTTPPPLFSKRERYSLALCSVAFIAFSGMVHMMAGSAGYGLFPHFTIDPTPSPYPLSLIRAPKRPPKPTPTPRLVVTALPKVMLPRIDVARPHKQTTRPHHTGGPPKQPYVRTPSPGPVMPSAPVVAPSDAPMASPTPRSPLLIQDGTFTYKAPLDYPPLALEQGIEGTVVILVTIGPDGELVSASVASSSGRADLDAAALKAAYASRYTPYYVNDVPVTQQYKIIYEFRLNSNGEL